MKTYHCHKSVNRPMEFRGLQAQYIWWMAGVMITSLLLFAALHLCGVSSLVCLPLVLTIGGTGVAKVYRMSRIYGRHGLMKKWARRHLPTAIRSRSRAIFQQSINKNGKAIG